jgi:uncharacterized protein (DUF305 family)
MKSYTQDTLLFATNRATRKPRLIGTAIIAVLGLIAGGLKADAPGRGLTAAFEINYLKTAIDHHFAALRITELAAGTDAVRDPQITNQEGTSATPGYASTPAKATLDDIKSSARRANGTQREEILEAQKFLHDWYGINYQPHISDINRARIQLLEETPAGSKFNHFYLEVFARHHFTIMVRSVEAVTSIDLDHDALQRYARGILEGQINDVNDFRDMLCREFHICDYQPYVGLKGRHSGDHNELPSKYRPFDAAAWDEDEDQEHHR